MGNYYPPLGFHFSVKFNNLPDEFQFQSVSGLNFDLETEEIAEGGENRFKHKLLARARFQNLVLKRGFLPNSGLLNWCKASVNAFDIKPSDALITLLNEEHQPLASWNVVQAFPIKWAVADFNAEENNIVIETIELSYSYFNTL